MKKPNFFIAGAPKCGTTSLAHWLGEHPQIFMSTPKEPDFYCTDLNKSKVKDKAEYESLFQEATDEHIAVGEASTLYLYSNVAIKNLLNDNLNAKIIICLRNPAEMACSLHGQAVFGGSENIQDFEKAWRAQWQRVKGENIPMSAPEPSLLLYGAVCCLGSQLERLYETVPKEQVQIVFLDDLKKNPQDVYKIILEFLAVPNDGRKTFPALNKAARRRFPRLNRGIKTLRLLNKKNGVLRSGIGIASYLDTVNRAPAKKHYLSDTMKKELVDYFTPEVEKIEELTGRHLYCWKDEFDLNRDYISSR